MQPACENLPVTPGTTYRDTVRLMQPAFVYLPITTIAGTSSGVRLTVEHGLAGDWPVWVRGVVGMPALNREPGKATPWRARRLDADALEINQLSGAGLAPSGGELAYNLPVDLAGATLAMRFTRDGQQLLQLTLGAGLASPSPGTITRELTPAQTALLTGAWRYTLDVTFSDGTVTRYYEGGPAPARCGNGC
jgi:hypothetical protein